MNVLELVQEFCGKKTLPVPTAVIGNTDVGVVQIRYLLAETLRELSKYKWNEQKIQTTFTTIAAEDQGVLTTLIGADFDSLVFATMWDETLRRPVFGPVSDAMWANLQSFPASGPIYQFKVFGKHLHIFPAPTAGDTIYLIYQSSYPVTDSSGTPKAAITVDTDLFLLPEDVVTRSLDFRWKRQKGEPWETDYAEYTDLLAKGVQKTGLPNIHLDSARFKMTPGIWVPAGDWPV
jgi:hypothetical protein